MQKINKLYRKDYTGQQVITDMTHENGSWEHVYEWVSNDVFNNHISNQAIVIGNGPSRLQLNLNLIKNHKGGLLSRERLQSYGCNALYRDFAPDFLVAVGKDIVKEIYNSEYPTNNVVYTNGINILENPGKFHIIPQDPGWNAGSIATYMACFDGHKKVFLVGFDGQDTPGYNSNVYADTAGYAPARSGSSEEFFNLSMLEVFTTYNDVEFVRVMPGRNAPIPEDWKFCANFRQISYENFRTEADL
jgi:hypothetical protein